MLLPDKPVFVKYGVLMSALASPFDTIVFVVESGQVRGQVE